MQKKRVQLKNIRYYLQQMTIEDEAYVTKNRPLIMRIDYTGHKTLLNSGQIYTRGTYPAMEFWRSNNTKEAWERFETYHPRVMYTGLTFCWKILKTVKLKK